MKRATSSLLLALALALTAMPAAAKDKKKKGQKMDPAQQAMMQKWMEYSTPSAGHRELQAFVGAWDHTVQWWMDPKGKPEESKGESAIQWILGGRFLRHEARGTAMGQPFEGIGLIGYDNLLKKYNSVWIDNMATGMMPSSGTYDPATKTFNETGTLTDCQSGGTKPFRAVTTFQDADHYTYEMYTAGPDGQEFRTMKISYARKAAAK